jgi:hypothetical protein
LAPAATDPLDARGTACAIFITATGIRFAVGTLPVQRIFLIRAAATMISMISLAIAVNVLKFLDGSGSIRRSRLRISQLGGSR